MDEQHQKAEKELKELRRKLKNIERVHSKAHQDVLKSSNEARIQFDETLHAKNEQLEVQM